jgi:formate dehydrogenase iron-sulfur subunit
MTSVNESIDLLRSRSETLVRSLIDDQSDLTAVERFAQAHEDVDAPLRGRFYASLLPSTPPGPGQQLAFEVDLDRCSGCKACVAACHSLNGLDEHETWRDVGLIVGGMPGLPVLQHVTTACHHCVEPACLAACPVDAYEKDPITGIVRHLDDQCFGCQYCTLACPYDVPKYHAGKGIVRKCDMCADRLAVGEAPACVQACPSEAIRIRVVDVAEVAARAEAGEFLVTAPSPTLTLPTTRYVSSRPMAAGVRAADHYHLVPEHIHTPLMIMLVLTQLSVGAILADFVTRLAGHAGGLPTLILLAIGLGFGHLGLVASTLHLGRPQFAYRALIGLRHSWLSREIAAFGAFAAFATPHVALSILCPDRYGRRPALGLALSMLSLLAGIVGVACSVMVYHATRRPFWGAGIVAPRFAATSGLLGAAVLLVACSWSNVAGGPSAWGLGTGAALATIAFAALKVRDEVAFVAGGEDANDTPLQRSIWLLKGRPLATIWRLRVGLCVVGGMVLPCYWLGLGPAMAAADGAAFATLAMLATTAGELVERYLFFAAVVRPKMPGGMAR